MKIWGKVIEIGKAIRQIKVGDWVCLPFNVSCGSCKNCERGFDQRVAFH